MTMRKSFDCVARCKRKLLISQKMTAKERLNVSAFPFLAFIFWCGRIPISLSWPPSSNDCCRIHFMVAKYKKRKMRTATSWPCAQRSSTDEWSWSERLRLLTSFWPIHPSVLSVFSLSDGMDGSGCEHALSAQHLVHQAPSHRNTNTRDWRCLCEHTNVGAERWNPFSSSPSPSQPEGDKRKWDQRTATSWSILAAYSFIFCVRPGDHEVTKEIRLARQLILCSYYYLYIGGPNLISFVFVWLRLRAQVTTWHHTNIRTISTLRVPRAMM